MLHMFKPLSRRLAIVTVIAAIALAPTAVAPAQAATVASQASNTTVITAGSVGEAREAIGKVLAANDASREFPRVDADLTPKLEAAVAAGGGTVRTEVVGLPIKIVIKCEITFPPLKIKCTVDIIIDL